jgi:hypothetical protein
VGCCTYKARQQAPWAEATNRGRPGPRCCETRVEDPAGRGTNRTAAKHVEAALPCVGDLVVNDTNDLQLRGSQKRVDAGEKALQECRPLLHPLEPGFHQRGELAEVALG